uniref:V-set immunoregulatory receptor n=1 Tax=Neogobius melanostomus TaxID=47308 RepID=A0A8C6S3E1_9GOBI
MTRRERVCRGLRGNMLLFCAVLVNIARANADLSQGHATLGVSAPHMYYTCPEGATVKLVCNQRGATKYPTDKLHHNWLFTQHSDQQCLQNVRPRNIGHKPSPGVHSGANTENFWLTMENVTSRDQGRYCCMALDVQETNKHKVLLQRVHSHVVLTVTPKRNGSQECTYVDPTPPGGVVPVALAVAACVLALLSLPLILVLVYKQRQSAHSSRRAQELVRMDSESQGHENPVFLGGTPEVKTRTVSQIMTRQSSETGRHLLSEPGTPFSPPCHGDVFFPAEDPIPESPDLL